MTRNLAAFGHCRPKEYNHACTKGMIKSIAQWQQEGGDHISHCTGCANANSCAVCKSRFEKVGNMTLAWEMAYSWTLGSSSAASRCTLNCSECSRAAAPSGDGTCRCLDMFNM